MVEKTLLFQRLLTRNVLIRVDVNISTVRKKNKYLPSGFWAKAPINRPQNTISPFILNFLSFKMSFFQREIVTVLYTFIGFQFS